MGAARTILHLDMDAFFASVELLRRPALRGRPVVVGGAGPRGVVAAASYEARVHGVHSAMATATARRRCPGLVVVPPDHAHYAAVSRRLMSLLGEVSPAVEPLSLDEAFVELTGTERLWGPAEQVAADLRARVLEREGLTCSVGVAPVKFLAKLASESAKPRVGGAAGGPGRGSDPGNGAGVVVVAPGGELAFLHPLPVSRLWGVGPATLARLERLGIATVGDLARLPVAALQSAVGRAVGTHLHELAWARDDRPVVPDAAPRSVSHEETFPVDLTDRAELGAELVRLADAVAARLRAGGLRARTVQLKVRRPDRSTLTRSVTLAEPTDRGTDLAGRAGELLDAVGVGAGVRLLGVGAANLTTAPVAHQLRLDAQDRDVEWDRANRAVDEVRARFGSASIGPARLVGGDDGHGRAENPPADGLAGDDGR